MLGCSVLVHTCDDVGARTISRCIRAAGNEIARTRSVLAAAELVSARAVDLVVVDYSDAASLQPILRAAQSRIPVLAISCRPDPRALIDLVCDHEVEHWMSSSGDPRWPLRSVNEREIVVTTEKVLQRDIFGIGKYLPEFGVEVSVCEIRHSSDRSRVADCARAFLGSLGVRGAVESRIATIIDELATNAIYHAPRLANGRPRYAAFNRHDELELGAAERVRIRFASDGCWFALSVMDEFGALRPDDIRAGLRHCVRTGSGGERITGGGLGLYTALLSCNQLVFNIEPGVRTEVLALVDLRERRDHPGHSLHLFSQRPRHTIPQGIPEVISSKVVLSNSMRIDLRDQLAHVVHQRGLAPPVPLRARPIPPRMPRAPSSELSLPSSAPGSGLDTVLGIVRGASSRETAMETAVRFLATDYRAVIAFEVGERAIRTWLTAGRVTGFPELASIALDRTLPCTLTRVADNGSTWPLDPTSLSIDRRIVSLAATAAADANAGMAIPIRVAGAVRYILCGCAPRFGELTQPRAMGALRAELERTLERVDTGFPSLAPWTTRESPYDSLEVRYARALSEPYAELEVSTRRARSEPPYAELRVYSPA